MALLRFLKDPTTISSKSTIIFAGNLLSQLFGVTNIEDQYQLMLNAFFQCALISAQKLDLAY